MIEYNMNIRLYLIYDFKNKSTGRPISDNLINLHIRRPLSDLPSKGHNGIEKHVLVCHQILRDRVKSHDSLVISAPEWIEKFARDGKNW